jgi:hypothetical protein
MTGLFFQTVRLEARAPRRYQSCVLVQNRVLALIVTRPGSIARAEIYAALPDAKRKSVESALRRLTTSGRIERAAWGWYQTARQPGPPPCPPPPISRQQLARLMAGR